MDPSAASFIACIAAHRQFRVIPADNAVLTGIRQVSEALQQDRLRFSAGCSDILREFGQYCWKEDSAGDVPKKENDHAMDDMRYFVSTMLHGTQKEDFVAITVGR